MQERMHVRTCYRLTDHMTNGSGFKQRMQAADARERMRERMRDNSHWLRQVTHDLVCPLMT